MECIGSPEVGVQFRARVYKVLHREKLAVQVRRELLEKDEVTYPAGSFDILTTRTTDYLIGGEENLRLPVICAYPTI